MVLTYDIDAQNQTQQVAKSYNNYQQNIAKLHVGKRTASLIL